MKRYPGKFEGCGDHRLGERLYKCTLEGWCDDEFGSSCEIGWHGLIYRQNRKVSYHVYEDTQGFFDYEEIPSTTVMQIWNEFMANNLPDDAEDMV